MPERWAGLTNSRRLFGLYVVMTIAASLAKYLTDGPFVHHTATTQINNFMIFKSAFFNLRAAHDLYLPHPAQYFDLYKYSPTFALLMAPIALLPDLLGLCVWNLLNALALSLAITTLPVPPRPTHSALHWFIALPLLTSVQNAQSNGLVAALLLGTFHCLEQRWVLRAALCISLAFYIKLFGIVAVVLGVLYPDRGKLLAALVLWLALLGGLPLLVISADQLALLYTSWGNLLWQDHTASVGVSVFGVVQTWLPGGLSKGAILVAGVLLLCLPFVRARATAPRPFRVLFLASLLLWVVLFNHKAEAASFVIAMCGIALWYCTHPKTLSHTLLVGAAFVLTALAPTDVFPPYVRAHYVVPWVLMAVPCLAIWVRMQYQLLATPYPVA